MVSVYGIFLSEEEIKRQQDDAAEGVIRHHEMSYLECEIPQEIEERLFKIIEKEINKFTKTCQCENCKEIRKNKHK